MWAWCVVAWILQRVMIVEPGCYRLLGVVVSRGRNLLPSPFRTEWDSGRFGWLKWSIGEVGRLSLKMNSG